MPVYEYVCRRCAHPFEELVSGEEPPCPRCQATEVDKVLSVFAVGRASTPAPSTPSPCGSCSDPRGPGACRWS